MFTSCCCNFCCCSCLPLLLFTSRLYHLDVVYLLLFTSSCLSAICHLLLFTVLYLHILFTRFRSLTFVCLLFTLYWLLVIVDLCIIVVCVVVYLFSSCWHLFLLLLANVFVVVVVYTSFTSNHMLFTLFYDCSRRICHCCCLLFPASLSCNLCCLFCLLDVYRIWYWSYTFTCSLFTMFTCRL